MPEIEKDTLDTAASDENVDNARDGAQKRRDPNEPVAVVGLGASAGGVVVLQQFFGDMPADSGMAFVVVMHLSPDFESQLAGVIQHKTAMPVVQVSDPVHVRPNHVYVIPPNKQLGFANGTLEVTHPQQALGRRVTIDLFFRTLAHSYGQRAVGVILSGADQDGVIGLKHLRAQGGVTIAQDPEEAEHNSMPAAAIKSGMVDWVLPVAQIAPKLMEFVHNEMRMKLPPEIPAAKELDAKVKDAPGGPTVSDQTRDETDEWALGDVLEHLREQTGHDFTHYKRATLLRRVARRLQVNLLESIPQYLEFIRSSPGEPAALLQDLLIGVTHFFRDPAAFAALQESIPQLFAGKKNTDHIRVWVAGCATGEEAYSIAMLLCEHADRLESPPSFQIFATDIDEQSIHEARDGTYPSTIEADVSLDRLRRFFLKDDRQYRVKKDLRDMVLFASHNLLADAPFSRLDLVSCRNLLIYLNKQAQEQAFDVFHFSLRAGGLLFIGSAEATGTAQSLFSPVDANHRLFVRRSIPRPYFKVPVLPSRLPTPQRKAAALQASTLRTMSRAEVDEAATDTRESNVASQERRSILFGELHLKLLEHYGPPSVLVNEAHNIVHLSERAGRYLKFMPGEPSTNLLSVVQPSLRVELRTALFRASQSNENVILSAQQVQVDGRSEVIDVHVRPIHPSDSAHGFFLVLFEKLSAPLSPEAVAARHQEVGREMDDELHFLKEQLHGTVEQYEASSEELKASNEELQAMNEEMRSAAEELETSQEELKSVNEELTTVNAELNDKVNELSHANSDLQNLMLATDVGTIFLDRQMRIKRFTPRVQEVFNLLASDIGRPISDITQKLSYKSLIEDAKKVLQSLRTIETEVRVGEDSCYLVRVSPYRTADDHIAGVVATFIDISERKRSEMALQDLSKQMANQLHKFNTVMTAVPDFIYHFDLEGRFTYVNQSLLDLWQKTSEQAIGKNFYELDYPPELAERLHRQIQEVIEKRRALKDETPYTSALGSRMYEYIFFPLLAEDGAVEAVAGTTRDITDRKETEEALRKSEERYRTLFELVPVAVYSTDAKGVIQQYNRRAVELWGRAPREGEKFCGSFKILRPDGTRMPHEECPMARVLREEDLGPADLEITVEQEDGTRKNVIVSPSLRRNERGEITGAINCLFDITERKLAGEALRESEARFRAMFEQANVGIMQMDSSGRLLSVNPGFCAIVGYTEAELQKMQVSDIIDAADWEKEKELLRQLTTGEIGEYTMEKRYQRKDGTLVWGCKTATLVRGDAGGAHYTLGIVQPITERKEAEEQLRSSEERYRLLVDGASDYAIFMVNPSNDIVYWSAGAERVFGWTAEEAIGQSGELVFTPEDRAREQEEKEIEIALRKGNASDRRWHMRKDGTRIWVDGVMHRLDDEQTGALRGFAKVARDRTQQRKAEIELRRAHEELERRVQERTAELRAKNRLLQLEMNRRQILENEILSITERERARIGQDLHDSLCQELTATAFLLKSRAKAIKPQSKVAADSLSEAAETVNANAGLARDLARGLHSFELGSAGLPSALRELCSRTGERINCRCDCPRSLRLEQDVALNLYRIAQEAVTNCVKHSKANEIVISLERTHGEIVLAISDDGEGKERRRRGLGTHIMEYRARAAGGTLQVESGRGRGTTVTCRVSAKK